MKSSKEQVELLAKTISMLSVDAVEKANSGHPGLPMGASLFSSVLWSEFLRFDPKEPEWINRDRFVLSAGHGSMLLYSLLHLFGYPLTLEDIKKFRQWESKTPGHPECFMTQGVEATTGPLGQGFANGVGMALSAKLLAEQYGEKVFNYRTFGLVSDGDLMEGIASEAASLAGHLGLDNLVYIWDDNKISLAGKTDVCFTESVPTRFEAYGWYVQEIDGHDAAAVRTALENAIKELNRPSIICARTQIGHGSPNRAGSFKAHGSPLGAEETKLTKEAIGWPTDKPFYIPPEVQSYCAAQIEEKRETAAEWRKAFAAFESAEPKQAAALQHQLKRELPTELREALKTKMVQTKPEATRSLSGKAIQIMGAHLPALVGGSADLETSTKTLIDSSEEIQKKHFKGRNIRFGVREHGMGGIVNGLAYSRCWFPFSATFLVFSDYMRPSMRLAALSDIQSFFIFTHDSFWVGEDGPTHQPIEHVMSLRLIPDLYVFRPADGIEVGASYLAALEHRDGPSTFVFSRQDLPPLERTSGATFDDALKGGYVVSTHGKEQLAIIATGSEVGTAQSAAKLLEAAGIGVRVVSLPCVELFKKQSAEYQEKVLPSTLRRVSFEAGTTLGWSSLLGGDILAIGIDHFGSSAPGEELAVKFGFTAEALAARIKAWV